MAKRHNEPYRLFKRGDIYHAYISYIDENGARIQFRETTRTTDEAKAIQYCIKRIAQLQKKARQQANGELPCITIDEAFARYFQEKGQYLTLPQQRLSRLSKLKHDLKIYYLHEITEQIGRAHV